MPKIHVLPHERSFQALPEESLLDVLRREGLLPNVPCGGAGKCGKCTVMVNGTACLACQTVVREDMTVTLPEPDALRILVPETGDTSPDSGQICAAVDIGTTSVVCTLLHRDTGSLIGVKAAANPQGAFGADVVSRLRASLDGEMSRLTALIREAVTEMLLALCRENGRNPAELTVIAVVGNPAMQQLFLGLTPDNLVKPPFNPVLTRSEIRVCGDILPPFSRSGLMTVPDISGYVGADTVGCILTEKLQDTRKTVLLVDIGTNGEMVLSHKGRLVACATAAGPALEGANIRLGMRAAPGAIDHVWIQDSQLCHSTIENSAAVGICGSGLIDAAAVLLDQGLLNSRGKILNEQTIDGQRCVFLTEKVYLTQEDIRQLQLAKGAIRAGIDLMLKAMGISAEDVSQCLLAGAFGTYLNPQSACRIGLLPPELAGKIRSVGNAALSGAIRIALNPPLLEDADRIVRETEYLELASLEDFPKTFAKAMYF